MLTTYLITGGNRGLGKGLVATYLRRPDNTVIAAVRDPDHPSSKALYHLDKAASSRLIVVKIDSTNETDPQNAITSLKSSHNISAIDVVIANAGISAIFPTVAQVQPKDMIEHFHVNVIGPALLFQAVLPLMKHSTMTPKFVTLSTSAATITDMEQRDFPNSAYGTSKAALNYITKKIHLENSHIIAFPIDPGWVQTDMGNAGAKLLGFDSAEITIDESISGMVKVIDTADKDKTSGKFMNYKDEICLW